ncbi:hypothetical protein [Belliella aquatica]|uniref:Uncharacterized protein n=1 Tax=Belliella aquatica TaxID=1323734 RepID=A0ABQ1M6Q1_9BACT|nr:hypothetical protein [Belliella aquatica]MCH7406827.1 hypothetical protein [Belliella aquatica]GGC32427.1 hypothetical protein GCM10010993_09250 [Belliella aquatica]
MPKIGFTHEVLDISSQEKYFAKGKTQLREIMWEKAVYYEDKNIVEVPILYNFHPVPSGIEKTKEKIQQKQESSFYRLILVPNGENGFHKLILKFFPENSSPFHRELTENNFFNLSKEFSGDVRQFSWDEKFKKGWKIKKGQIIGFTKPYYEVGSKSNIQTETLNQDGCYTYIENECLVIDNIFDCYDIPVVQCPEKEEPNEDFDGGINSGPIWSPNNWHGFWPGFGYGNSNTYYNSNTYWNSVYATLTDYTYQANPGIKDHNSLNKSQRLLHILNHIEIAKQQNRNVRIRDIFTNLPSYASGGPYSAPGGSYESGDAFLKINGQSSVIGFTYGFEQGYDYINMQVSPDFHDASYKDQVNYYFEEVNYPGRSALEIRLPIPLRNWFESKFF